MGEGAQAPIGLLHDCQTIVWTGETPISLAQAALPDGYQASGRGTATIAVEAFDCAGIQANGTWIGRAKFATIGVVVGEARGLQDPENRDFYLLQVILDPESPEVLVATRGGPWKALAAEIFVTADAFGIRDGSQTISGGQWVNAVLAGPALAPPIGSAGQERMHVDDPARPAVDATRLGYQSQGIGELSFGTESPLRKLFVTQDVTNIMPGRGRASYLDTYELHPAPTAQA